MEDDDNENGNASEALHIGAVSRPHRDFWHER